MIRFFFNLIYKNNPIRFAPPASIPTLGRRLARNIDHFQSNYIYVFAILIAYCLLTSPMLLLCIGASLGACYILSLKNKERKVKLMGKEVSLAQQYAGVGLASIPIFILAGMFFSEENCGFMHFAVVGLILWVLDRLTNGRPVPF